MAPKPAATPDGAETYLQALGKTAPKDHPLQYVLAGNVGLSKVFYSSLPTEDRLTTKRVTEEARDTAKRQVKSVCIIENITREWIATLGPQWDIDHDFFLTYFSNPASGEGGLWEATTEVEIQNHKPAAAHYIEGVLPHIDANASEFPFQRRRERHSFYGSYTNGSYANCRTSYCRVSEYLCEIAVAVHRHWRHWLTEHLDLFLVDRPFEREETPRFWMENDIPPARLTLWVPYSSNRGGLPIPQLYKTGHFSMLESLQSVFSHQWMIGALFGGVDTTNAVDPVSLSYLVSASLWRTNLQYLDRSVKVVAFRDLRRPSVDINDRLHDLRQDLNMLRDEVALARRWILQMDDSASGLSPRYYFVLSANLQKSVTETLDKVLEDSKALEGFLMDTFQLLMSTISVLDSQASILDARRGARLTALATIYVPLSFVTGIFGMNLREINGSPLPSWVAVIALVVVSLTTGALLWAMTKLPDPTAPVTDDRRKAVPKVTQDRNRRQKGSKEIA